MSISVKFLIPRVGNRSNETGAQRRSKGTEEEQGHRGGARAQRRSRGAESSFTTRTDRMNNRHSIRKSKDRGE